MPKFFRFLLGFLVMLACLSLQFWLVPFGIHADLAFTALILFAFLFELWELVAFTLFALFVLNWQPGISLDIVAFALIPFVVFFVRRRMRVNAWIGTMVAVVVSLLVLYLIVAPLALVSSFPSFFLDVILCLSAAQVIFWGMESRQ